MEKLSFSLQRKVRRYEEIEIDGLTLYPIRVSEIEDFMDAQPALEVMQQAFPVELVSIPLMTALYRMDLKAYEAGEQPMGYFYRCLLLLALALRLGEGLDAEKRVNMFQVVVDPDNVKKLKSVRCLLGGIEQIEITPVQFAELRMIIAAQNGVEIPNDDLNPDLVRAERDIAAQQAAKLDWSLDTLLSTIATLSGTDESEMDDWPILKLKKRERTYERVIGNITCKIAEMQGTTWKGGNPYPNLFFDKKDDGMGGMMALEDFAGGQGVGAVASGEAGNEPPPEFQRPNFASH